MHAIRNPRAEQQAAVRAQAHRCSALAFFNLLTGPELFARVEALLPPHRERRFPPTETLSMFLSQALSADRSCQTAVDETAIRRLAAGVAPGIAARGRACRRRW